jgi:hypothetical protein
LAVSFSAGRLALGGLEGCLGKLVGVASLRLRCRVSGRSAPIGRRLTAVEGRGQAAKEASSSFVGLRLGQVGVTDDNENLGHDEQPLQ